MFRFHGRPTRFNFVLLGKSGSGKTATANTMLRTETRTSSATLDFQKRHGRFYRNVCVVYDTPGFSSTKLTDKQVREKCQDAISECESVADICTYLLVIRIGRFTDEERKTVETIENLLGEDRLKKTWILFTGGDELEDTTNKIEDFINELDAMKELVQKYENRYHVFNNKMRGSSEQVRCLLNKVETAKKNPNLWKENCRRITSTHPRDNGEIFELDTLENGIHLMHLTDDQTTACPVWPFTSDIIYCTGSNQCTAQWFLERGARSKAEASFQSAVSEVCSLPFHNHLAPPMVLGRRRAQATLLKRKGRWKNRKSEELRIVLLGKTGAGKSAAGNTILNKKCFESTFSLVSVTSKSTSGQASVEDRRVSVIDTPGLFDTKVDANTLAEEIGRCIWLSSPGPHAFLIVLPVNIRFTEWEKEIIQRIEMLFGKEVAKYTIILFTHGDQIEGADINELITENRDLNELIQQCGAGYHIFNNENQTNREQVTELLQKIDRMVEQNGGSCYTNEMFQEADREKKEMEKRAVRLTSPMNPVSFSRDFQHAELKMIISALHRS